jgi:hypothetical protein
MPNQADPWRHHRILRRTLGVSILFLFLTFAIVGPIDIGSRGFHVLVCGRMMFVLIMLALTR